MSIYRHGAYAYQLPTSIVPPRRVDSAIPVVVGCAPVHMVKDGYTGPINEPVLAHTYKEAVEALGFSANWAGAYTLSEFMYSQFVLFAVEPVVLINVFDPAVHKTAVAAEEQAFADDKIIVAHPGLVADPVVKSSDDVTTYVLDTDYTVDRITGTINRLDAGAIAADETVHVDYNYGDPTLVDADDIIGGIDAGTGALSGLELVNDVFPRFRLVPGLIVAPGFSEDPLVAAVMDTKAANINGLFRAMALLDLPSDAGGCLKYQDVPAWKNLNNYTGELDINCWPQLKLEGKQFHASTQMAGLIGRVDEANRSIPYESPSNKNLEMNGAVLADGTDVFLGHSAANYLNSQGIVVPLNWIGGWRAWGNRTGCYPANTDVKDAFIPIQRMFNWVGNEFILTYWQMVDKPLNRRLIERIIDSFNIRLNGLAMGQYILGGRIELLEEDNPITDLMDGIVQLHIYLTPPAPAKEIAGLLEFDPSYVSTLFGT